MLLSLITACDYKTISIVGLAKNSGKTVTLNHLISEAIEAEVPIGVTSIGRDGEGLDIVTQTEKPRIYVEEGTIVATAATLLELGDANIEILNVTNHTTPLGNVILGKVRSPGYIQIAGPQSLKEVKNVADMMLSLGAKFVIIDGALDRKSSAAPAISDATILSTGAVLSRDMNRVIEETLHTINIFGLPPIEDIKTREIASNLIAENNVAIIDKDYNVLKIDVETALGAGSIIGDYLKEDSKFLVIPGSLVKSTVEDLIQTTRKYKNIEIIVNDGSKIFINPKDWLRFNRYGVKVRVLQPINLIGVTVNPYSPSGYYFEPVTFLNKMKSYINNIPVMDLMLGGG